MNMGTQVTLNGEVVLKSRNLRGMRDYASISPVATVDCKLRNGHANDPAGILSVTYANGASSVALFNSYNIMVDFVRTRRTWKRAVITFHDGNTGYFTAPGVLA